MDAFLVNLIVLRYSSQEQLILNGTERRNAIGDYYWHSPSVVRGWVDEFNQWDNNTSIFFNYGACVGCPTVISPSWVFTPGPPWTQEHVWYVSWGAQPAFAIPEIYSNNGVLARQWAAVSKYGSLYKASRIIFTGAMTQMQACQQRASSDPSVVPSTIHRQRGGVNWWTQSMRKHLLNSPYRNIPPTSDGNLSRVFP